MADSKKSIEGLEGREVEVFLKTPLFRFRYMVHDSERELMENAVRISGVVIKERSAGLILKVNALSNMRQIEKELPFEQIFLPYGKIDFVVLE